MTQTIVCNDDIRWFEQHSKSELTMIVGQMTSLMEAIADTKHDTDARVAKLQNQGWFKRLWNTITGKNKATKEEIRRNQDKIVGYISQAVAKLFELGLIEMKAIQSLGNRINQVYAQLTEYYNEQLQMKAQITEIQEIQKQTIQALGEIASKLDEKIESVDNYHTLITNIEHGYYQNKNKLFSICSVLSQLDKRVVNDRTKVDTLIRVLDDVGIADSETVSIENCIMSILSMSEDEIGTVYIELCNYREDFPANIFVEAIEEFHFLSKLEKMSKKKETIIRNVLDKYDIDGDSEFTYSDLFENFIENKTHTFVNLELLTLSTKDESNTMSSENAPSSGKGWFGTIGSAFVSALKSLPDEVVDAAEEVSEDDEIIEDNDEESAIVDEGLQLYWKGLYYEDEKSSKLDIAKDYFKKAAEKGHSASFFHIEYYMKAGYERESFAEKEAKRGNVEAMYLLGLKYRNQYHGSQHMRKIDDEKAKPFLEKAALKGHIPAQYAWGKWYAHHYTSYRDTVIGSWTYDKYDIINDYDNAFVWVKKAADAGYPPAQMKLGYYYTEGKGVQKDLKQAFDLYLKAAIQGYDEATYEIGKRYHKGIGVAQDLNKAIEWYKKSNEYWAKDALEKLGVKK